MTSWILIAGWTLVHFVWQGALLAAIAAVGLTLLRNATPESRYAVASVTLALMLSTPIVTATWLSSPRGIPAPVNPTKFPTLAIRETGSPSTSMDPMRRGAPVADKTRSLTQYRVFAVVVTAWLSGVLLLSVRLLSGWWQLRRLQRIALRATASAWQAVSDRLGHRLRLRRHVHVVESPAVEVPSVLGLWRPVLLLPLTAFAGLTPAQAEAVLTHELAHIWRHDYVVNVLQHVTETVLFYHPAVWWISHRMRMEREHCCDALVVRLCGDARDYAAALVQLEEGRRAPSTSLAVAATTRPLFTRIRRMLSRPGDRHQPVALAMVTTLIALCFPLFIGGAYRWSTPAVHASVSEPAATIATVTNEPIRLADPDRFRALSGAQASAPARAYADSRAATAPQAQGGTPVPGRLTTPPPDWRVTATDHFDIFATPELAAQVGRVQQAAERAYQHVSGDLRHDLDVRPSLLLFATRSAARAANGAMLPKSATPSVRTLLPLDMPDDDFQATVTHEIAHAFEFNIVPRTVLAAAPTWIVEGLSEYEGGAWGVSDQAILRDLVRTDTVPALSTVDTTPGLGNPRLPYSLGHAAFDFIAARWGADGIRRLFLALRNGNVDREVLYTTAWDVSADEADRAFTAYLRVQFPAASALASPDLPKCLEDAGLISVNFKDATIPQVLTFLGSTCGVEVRLEGIAGTEAARQVPRLQFNNTKASDAFQALVRAAGLSYTVLDQRTLILTRQ